MAWLVKYAQTYVVVLNNFWIWKFRHKNNCRGCATMPGSWQQQRGGRRKWRWPGGARIAGPDAIHFCACHARRHSRRILLLLFVSFVSQYQTSIRIHILYCCRGPFTKHQNHFDRIWIPSSSPRHGGVGGRWLRGLTRAETRSRGRPWRVGNRSNSCWWCAFAVFTGMAWMNIMREAIRTAFSLQWRCLWYCLGSSSPRPLQLVTNNLKFEISYNVNQLLSVCLLNKTLNNCQFKLKSFSNDWTNLNLECPRKWAYSSAVVEQVGVRPYGYVRDDVVFPFQWVAQRCEWRTEFAAVRGDVGLERDSGVVRRASAISSKHCPEKINCNLSLNSNMYQLVVTFCFHEENYAIHWVLPDGRRCSWPRARHHVDRMFNNSSNSFCKTSH